MGTLSQKLGNKIKNWQRQRQLAMENEKAVTDMAQFKYEQAYLQGRLEEAEKRGLKEGRLGKRQSGTIGTLIKVGNNFLKASEELAGDLNHFHKQKKKPVDPLNLLEY